MENAVWCSWFAISSLWCWWWCRPQPAFTNSWAFSIHIHTCKHLICIEKVTNRNQITCTGTRTFVSISNFIPEIELFISLEFAFQDDCNKVIASWKFYAILYFKSDPVDIAAEWKQTSILCVFPLCLCFGSDMKNSIERTQTEEKAETYSKMNHPTYIISFIILHFQTDEHYLRYCLPSSSSCIQNEWVLKSSKKSTHIPTEYICIYRTKPIKKKIHTHSRTVCGIYQKTNS